MNKLTLRFKFILIVLLLSIPTAVATVLMSNEASYSIRFAQKELDGSRYLKPVVEMQRLIGEHRVATASSLVDKETMLRNVRSEIDKKRKELSRLNFELGETIDLGNDWNEVDRALDAMVSMDTTQRLKFIEPLHDEAADKLQWYKTLIGDKTNLIIDPALESFYLVDAMMLKLLPFMDKIESYRAVFSERTSFKYFEDHRFKLNEMSHESSGIANSIEKAMGHNTALVNELEGSLQQFQDAVKKAVTTADFLLVEPDKSIFPSAYDEMTHAINSAYLLFDDLDQSFRSLVQSRIEKDEKVRNRMLYFVLTVIAAGILFTYFVGRSITQAVFKAKIIAEAIAKDNLDNEICTEGRDETSQLMSALNNMQNSLNSRISEERRHALENSRIKQALECVSSVVLVVNRHGNIIYCNNAGTAYFEQHKDKFSADLGHVAASDIIGHPATILTDGLCLAIKENSSHASQTLNRVMGGRHVQIVVSPVQDEQQQEIGTVLEVTDRSNEVAVQKAVNDDVVGLVEAALRGDLSGRINAESKPDFLVPVYESINHMLEVCSAVIGSAGDLFKRLADGNLSEGMRQTNGIELKGEFMHLKNDADATVNQLSTMIAKVKNDAQVVSTAVLKVIEVNQRLEDNASAAASKAQTVAESMDTVATNVDTIAGAATQMNASISDMNKNTQRSSGVAEEAVSLTRAANQKIVQLSDSSQSIGNMVNVINSIAEQTNLLALNATIEAARAGDAGKGFAVVAKEVKELAMETAKATEEISEKIRAIQGDSESAVDGIRAIDGIVVQIRELQAGNSVAMEEQSKTTQEISRSINGVASGTSSISAEASYLVEGTEDASKEVQQAKVEVMRLGEVAESLKMLVDNFEIGVGTQPQAEKSAV